VTIPDLPSTAPEAHLLSDPHVPEHRRFCGHCNATLRRERGYCNQCGQKYSFVPSLQAGDLVAEQYEVKGAMAYGGLGWIYLGFDQMLSRYVVLKGLLNAEDAASAAVALAERKFLASVKHPNIVGVYNFVNHGGEGFIVMEYIQGQTLKVIRKQRGRLPVGEAIAYIHRILSAFAYLHESGLVYCDFKPDNAMLEDGDVKLIDMGGVRRLDDSDGDIYGTVGYSAPEIAADGPSVASDLFTVGRTLAVLLIDIPEFNKTHQFSLPAPEQEPLFAQQESLYRFLLKATAYKAEQRFQSAEAMAEQLLGVLREVAALETGQPSPASSRLFGGDPLVLTASPDAPIAADYHQLSLPLLDAADPAFNALLTALAVPDLRQRQVSLDQVMQQFPDSSEAQLQRINNLIELRNYKQARAALGKFMQKVQRDWRFTWCYGKLNLAEELPVSATDYFEQIYTDLPGELAPKLALAIATEQAGQRLRAIQLYRLIASTDPGYVSASFGLARCLFAKGDRQAAIAALGQIPSDSILYTHAQMMAVRLLTSMTGAAGTVPQPPDLEQATRILEALRLEGLERHRLAQQLFETALMLLHSKAVPPQNSLSLLGQPWTEVAIRQGLEQSLRAQAQLAAGREKIKLVDAANRIRPLTWI
jgi:serine/threonine-protein kinase PknG